MPASEHDGAMATTTAPDRARAPIIISALLGPEDFGWLNDLRRAHFPPERNQLDAHLTLFHHLPLHRAGTQTAAEPADPLPPADGHG
jgi:hypothetical protein